MKKSILAWLFCLGLFLAPISEAFAGPIIVHTNPSRCVIWWWIVEEDTGEVLRSGVYRRPGCAFAITGPGGHGNPQSDYSQDQQNQQYRLRPLNLPSPWNYLNKTRGESVKNNEEIPTGYPVIILDQGIN